MRRRLILVSVIAFLLSVGVGMLIRSAEPTQTSEPRVIAPSASVSTTPTEKPWRPNVKVDWAKYPKGSQAKIDAAGDTKYCSDLELALDQAWRSGDKQLEGYVKAWLNHNSGVCPNTQYQTGKDQTLEW